jgi:hypothetical protein
MAEELPSAGTIRSLGTRAYGHVTSRNTARYRHAHHDAARIERNEIGVHNRRRG